MRRVLVFTLTLLVTTSLLLLPTVQTQQPQEDKLPVPADYPEAGANCKRRVNLSPWVGTPAVDWPKTYQCVLTIHTCDGVKTYRSGVRPGGTGMCADYWKAHDALVNREICCDPGAPEEKQPIDKEQPPEKACAPPTPWFDSSPGCNESKSSQLVISGGTATLYMCGHAVFYHTVGHDELFNDAYRAAIRDHLQSRGLDKVCCDKFNEAVRTGYPCDPRVDVDCDGQPNKSDVIAGGVLPGIDGRYTEASGANPDAFPPGLTVGAISPPTQCKDCKWELIRGVLKCNPDPTKRHTYEATWRCPTTGEVVQVDKLSKPGARCPY